MNKKEVIVILDNIRSTFNVGSIFRTSDALGINNIILCGTTPTPIDRFGRMRTDITKVSLGAEKTIPWAYEKSALAIVKKLIKAGYQIIAIEQAKNSIDYKKVKLSRGDKIVFIVGEEVNGISQPILKISDIVAEIPMFGEKESLNVSVAYGVAMFRMLNV